MDNRELTLLPSFQGHPGVFCLLGCLRNSDRQKRELQFDNLVVPCALK